MKRLQKKCRTRWNGSALVLFAPSRSSISSGESHRHLSLPHDSSRQSLVQPPSAVCARSARPWRASVHLAHPGLLARPAPARAPCSLGCSRCPSRHAPVQPLPASVQPLHALAVRPICPGPGPVFGLRSHEQLLPPSPDLSASVLFFFAMCSTCPDPPALINILFEL
jgi:hypothetical protein